MTHALKTWPPFFEHVVEGNKTFEVRENDREFKCGDTILLQEYIPNTPEKGGTYTGKEWTGIITYVLTDSLYCKKGFCILGIKEKDQTYY